LPFVVLWISEVTIKYFFKNVLNEVKVYNKLVRDLIPEIISSSGKVCTTHIAGDEEYRQELLKKLSEEVKEFLEEPCEEEIADVLEVLDGLIEVFGFSHESIGEIKEKKKRERGGFSKKIVLECVEER